MSSLTFMHDSLLPVDAQPPNARDDAHERARSAARKVSPSIARLGGNLLV